LRAAGVVDVDGGTAGFEPGRCGAEDSSLDDAVGVELPEGIFMITAASTITDVEEPVRVAEVETSEVRRFRKPAPFTGALR
jgi:hypothetical protein